MHIRVFCIGFGTFLPHDHETECARFLKMICQSRVMLCIAMLDFMRESCPMNVKCRYSSPLLKNNHKSDFNLICRPIIFCFITTLVIFKPMMSINVVIEPMVSFFFFCKSSSIVKYCIFSILFEYWVYTT